MILEIINKSKKMDINESSFFTPILLQIEDEIKKFIEFQNKVKKATH